jgi:hypothetical protein
MSRIVAVLALMAAFAVGFARPAPAEFFGCNDQHSSRSYTRTSHYSTPLRVRHYYSSARMVRAGSRHASLDRSHW